IEITDVRPSDLRMIRITFERMGIRVEVDGDSLRVPPAQDLRILADEGDAIPKIDDGPWPAFPADLTSIATAVATQAHGTVMIFEEVFEARPVLRGQAGRDGRAHHPVRPARGRRERAGPPDGVTAGEPGHPGGHGHADREPGGRRRQHDRERGPDRPGLRADRRAPSRSRRPDRAGAGVTEPAEPDGWPDAAPLPAGARDVLPVEGEELAAIEGALRSAFPSFGYREVRTPVLEFADVMDRAQEGGLGGRAFRLFDDHGEVLVLRPDLTIPVARLVAGRLREHPGPVRVSYVAQAL